MTYTLTADQLSDLRNDCEIPFVQSVTITGFPTGGTFTLAYAAQTTGPIAFDADSVAVEAALQGLSTIGIGNAVVTGASKGPFTTYIASDDGTGIVAGGTLLTGGTSPAIRVGVHVIFSDTQLNRNFERAQGDYDLAVVITLRQMLAKAAKIAAYTIGADVLYKQKIFDNTEKLLLIWEKLAGVDGGSVSTGTMSLGLDLTVADLENTDWSGW